jgi:hypothetical protein
LPVTTFFSFFDVANHIVIQNTDWKNSDLSRIFCRLLLEISITLTDSRNDAFTTINIPTCKWRLTIFLNVYDVLFQGAITISTLSIRTVSVAAISLRHAALKAYYSGRARRIKTFTISRATIKISLAILSCIFTG